MTTTTTTESPPKCAACGKPGPFSKRQLKRGERARCSVCIDNNITVPNESSKHDNNTKENNGPNCSDGAGASSSSSSSSSDSSSSSSISSDSSSSSSSNTSDSEKEPTDVSLAAIKQQVLGRQIQTSHEEDTNLDDVVLMDDKRVDLRKELSCPICHDLLYQPVSLLCGHSFCSECLNWWLTRSENANGCIDGSCPTCRRGLKYNGTTALGISAALRACISAIFGEELATRIRADRLARRKATAGENGGAHSEGYKVLTAIDTEQYKCLLGSADKRLSARRSIVMDAKDQRMHLALALRGDPVYNSISEEMDIEVCLVTMEEDEACEGFPLVVVADEDDEHLVCKEERFLCNVEATARIAGGASVPIARRNSLANDECAANFHIELGTIRNATVLCFRHEETGAEFEIKLPKRGSVGEMEERSSQRAMEETGRESNHQQDDYNHDEDVGEYEEDGFLVFDENEEEDEDSGADEDDVCCLCKQHGELIICDGGENMEGCGRNFHIGCVKRNVVPPGDWVCETCANAFEISAGIEGHEFAIAGEETGGGDVSLQKSRLKRLRSNALENNGSDEEEFEVSKEGHEADPNDSDGSLEVLPQRGKGKKARRMCIDDSEEDE